MKKKTLILALLITPIAFGTLQETRWREGQNRDMSQRRDKWDLRTPSISTGGIPEAGARLESKGVIASEFDTPGDGAYQALRTLIEKHKAGKPMPRFSNDPEIRAFQIPMEKRRKTDLGTPQSKINTGAPPEMKALAK